MVVLREDNFDVDLPQKWPNIHLVLVVVLSGCLDRRFTESCRTLDHCCVADGSSLAECQRQQNRMILQLALVCWRSCWGHEAGLLRRVGTLRERGLTQTSHEQNVKANFGLKPHTLISYEATTSA